MRFFQFISLISCLVTKNSRVDQVKRVKDRLQNFLISQIVFYMRNSKQQF